MHRSDPLGLDELHCPKCRVVTRLPEGGVFNLPINYALKEVAEALEDDITPSPPSSMGHHHHPNRQQSGMCVQNKSLVRNLA